MIFPTTRLLPGQPYTTAISGPNIQVLHTSTGHIRHNATHPAGPVRCAAIDPTSRYLATAADDKILKIWEIDGLKLVNERELPKRPTAVLFTADAKSLLVSDKFGDVFSYPFEHTPLTDVQNKDALSSHDNPSGGSLILGHTSLLYAFLLTPDETHIITADRDEHIRVSWFPQGYNIEMYCLGHTKFVSAIHNPAFAPAEIVSGGGDPVLKVWDWMKGAVMHDIYVWDAVEPYIRVRTSKRKRGAGGQDGPAPALTPKGRARRAKAKGKADAQGGADGVDAQDTRVVATALAGSAGMEEKAEKVLVIRKIATTPSRHIIFSAVGATALFSVGYPGNGAPAIVRALDLGQPVLDFVAAPQHNRIWVTLDGNWAADGAEPTVKCSALTIEISESGELSKSASESPVTTSLNSIARLPATEDDLEKMELYNDLVAMPKGYEAENDPAGDAEQEKQSKRILGRLKNKQKVLDKERELAAAVDDQVTEPNAKKAKSDADDGQQDVDMAVTH